MRSSATLGASPEIHDALNDVIHDVFARQDEIERGPEILKALRAGSLPTTEVPWHESHLVQPSDFFATADEKEAVREWEATGHGREVGSHR